MSHLKGTTMPLRSTIAAALLAAGLGAVPAAAATDAAAGKKPGETFQDCADCQTMVVIPAGAFKMGSSDEERAREEVPPSFGDHEKPVVDVTIAKPFAIATTEATRAQFARFVEDTKRPIPTECAVYNPELDNWAGQPGKVFNWQKPPFEQTDDHPAVCISHDDASEYAAWMAKKTGFKYRLASEAEWEYAARGGTATARPWGDSVTSICQKAAIMTSGTFEAIDRGDSWADELVCADTRSWTVPVKSFDPNAFGVYDMMGSLWEWVSDCASFDHTGRPTDGSARTDGDCKLGIAKGGAYHSRTWLARPAVRGSGQSRSNRPVAAGIRIVREL